MCMYVYECVCVCARSHWDVTLNSLWWNLRMLATFRSNVTNLYFIIIFGRRTNTGSFWPRLRCRWWPYCSRCVILLNSILILNFPSCCHAALVHLAGGSCKLLLIDLCHLFSNLSWRTFVTLIFFFFFLHSKVTSGQEVESLRESPRKRDDDGLLTRSLQIMTGSSWVSASFSQLVVLKCRLG